VRTPASPTSDVAALGLGSNLGDSEDRLREAIRRLREVLQPLRAAPLFRTRPLGGLPQPPYLNTAVIGRPLLAAEELLAVAKALELAAGRRPAPRNAPRALDIDLLIYGGLVSSRPELTLPHPAVRQRRFVLAPLAAIAPGLAVPPDGVTVASLLAAIGQEDWVERLAWSEPP
jgi:2-amino-4-hydroxy-6-hydroxymethyldihydropteridine diphosphokinase